MLLKLTPDQASALSELLTSAIGDLHVELRHTETASYRHELHARGHALQAVLNQLNQAGAVALG